jgi:hypothetical protein
MEASLAKIDTIHRDFLWAACDKVIGGKCKVNLKTMCKPKEYEGIGIHDLVKFASDLRM